MARAARTRTSRNGARPSKEERLAKYQVYPELSYYYGLSFEEIWDMLPSVRKIYADALPRIIAQQQLRAIQAAAFPNLKKNAQRNITRKLERDSKPRGNSQNLKVEQDVKKATKDLSEMGIGVQFVDAKGEQTEAPDHLHEAAEEEVTEDARSR